MTAAHHPFGPSELARVMQCAASPAMQTGLPDLGDDSASLEGTAGHEAACKMVMGEVVKEGDLTSNGIAVSREMIEGGEEYAAYVSRIIAGRKGSLLAEQKVDLSVLLPGYFGTLDLVFMESDGSCLDLFEYKFGHRFHDEFEHWQSLAYLCAFPSFRKFRIHIIQPRCYHHRGICRMWEVSPKQVSLEYKPRMQAALFAATQPGACATTGSYCRDCLARSVCQAVRQGTGWVQDVVQAPLRLAIPPEAAGVELRYLYHARELLDAQISGHEAHIEHAIREGKRIPGWQITHGAGREKWQFPAEAVAQMGDAFNVNLRKAPDVLTPAQARKALKGTVDIAFIDRMTARTSGEAKLVPVDASEARRIFSTNHEEK